MVVHHFFFFSSRILECSLALSCVEYSLLMNFGISREFFFIRKRSHRGRLFISWLSVKVQFELLSLYLFLGCFISQVCHCFHSLLKMTLQFVFFSSPKYLVVLIH